MNPHINTPIQAREKLDFDLTGQIPCHWFGGDPFKSRFFDAMSTLFPEGERFFIASVRAYRDDIRDPQLAEDVRLFIRQEAQHGMVHTQYNQRLKAQGFGMDALQHRLKTQFARAAPTPKNRLQKLAETAATEHLTALLSDCLFLDRSSMAGADPRVRAMYTWHAVEEVEHKAVAFDVYALVARGTYWRRALALIGVTITFNLFCLWVTNQLLKTDGLGLAQRMRVMLGGVWALFRPGGLYWPAIGHYFQWFAPSFHPWQVGLAEGHTRWLSVFDRTGDPIQAGEALHKA